MLMDIFNISNKVYSIITIINFNFFQPFFYKLIDGVAFLLHAFLGGTTLHGFLGSGTFSSSEMVNFLFVAFLLLSVISYN